MLNYETLLSSYDDKLTLLQWLKKVEAALKDASAVSFNVNKKGDATLTFSIVFEDGSEIESGEIVLQQGESVESAAIVNGHLILTLTNGDELDAGQLLNGDLNVSGDLAVTGDVTATGDVNADGVYANEIIENMVGYSYSIGTKANITQTNSYVGVVKNGNKLTFTIVGQMERTDSVDGDNKGLGSFTIPAEVGAKLVPHTLGSLTNVLRSTSMIYSKVAYAAGVSSTIGIYKTSNTSFSVSSYGVNSLDLNTIYDFAFEITFLLSENLAA